MSFPTGSGRWEIAVSERTDGDVNVSFGNKPEGKIGFLTGACVRKIAVEVISNQAVVIRHHVHIGRSGQPQFVIAREQVSDFIFIGGTVRIPFGYC